MLHEAPVSKVAPLHHDWVNHYWDDDKVEDQKEEKNGDKENS